MTKIQFTKRRYTDIRYAIAVLSPVIAYSNFILLVYNFTDLKDMIPFIIFAPIFTLSLIVLLTFVGLAFRKKQQETDFTLAYERSVEAIRTSRIAMENMVEVNKAIGITPTKEYMDRLAYLIKIERREV